MLFHSRIYTLSFYLISPRSILTNSNSYYMSMPPRIFCFSSVIESWLVILQGIRFDPASSQTLRLEFARTNSRVSPKQQQTQVLTLKADSQYDATPTQPKRRNRNNFYSCVRGRHFGWRPPSEILFRSYCESAFSLHVIAMSLNSVYTRTLIRIRIQICHNEGWAM